MLVLMSWLDCRLCLSCLLMTLQLVTVALGLWLQSLQVHTGGILVRHCSRATSVVSLPSSSIQEQQRQLYKHSRAGLPRFDTHLEEPG